MFKIAAVNKDCYIRLVYVYIKMDIKRDVAKKQAVPFCRARIQGFIAQPQMSDQRPKQKRSRTDLPFKCRII